MRFVLVFICMQIVVGFKVIAEDSNRNFITENDRLDDLGNHDDVRDGECLPVVGVLVLGTTFSSGGYGVVQVLRAKRIAEQMAEKYYPDSTNAGQRGDAFRHVYVSVLLKKYLGRGGAWFIMGGVEFIQGVRGSNRPQDKYMDFHNNYLGRKVNYKLFVKKGEDNDWMTISKRVKKFIDDPKNGIRLSWKKNPPEKNKSAKKIASEVSEDKFIWYD